MMARCHDCWLHYEGFGWCDAMLPNDVWEKIAPEDGDGLLCFTCMARRCVKLGLKDVPIKITSGPFALAPPALPAGEGTT